MSQHFKSSLLGVLVVSLLGLSFSAFSASDEKSQEKECEPALVVGVGAVPTVEFRLKDISPSRVRIMPVGRHVRPHQTRNGATFAASVDDKNLQILAGEDEASVIDSIPFPVWEGLAPSWALDENLESVLIAVGSNRELYVFYPFLLNRPPLTLKLSGGEPKNAQVVRDRDGRVLMLVPRTDGSADMIALKGQQLEPVAVGPSNQPYLYEGLGDRPWLAWTESGSEMQHVIKTALFEGLTSPAFTWQLEPGEQVSEFGYERISEMEGQLIVVTNRRTLRFNSQSR